LRDSRSIGLEGIRKRNMSIGYPCSWLALKMVTLFTPEEPNMFALRVEVETE
jgi:hypothetical protein